jgi:parvulin-like peptidyl-prolyl isomerase
LPKNTEKPQRYVSPRQLSHSQRESRVGHIALLSGIIVIVAVLGLVGTGVYFNQFKPLRDVILTVDGRDYSMDYYINMLAYYGLTQGGSANIPQIADNVVQQIEQNKIIQDAAAKLDPPVTVSDAEVNATLQTRKLSSDVTRVDAVRAELLITKIKDYFDKNKVPASGEQKAVLAMFLESQTQANDVIARINKGEKFQDLAGQLSLEGSSKSKNGDFGWVPRGILSSQLGNTLVEDKVFSPDTQVGVFTTLIEDKDKTLGYWLVKVTESRVDPTLGPQMHLLTMLLGSQEQAANIKQQLDNGADWATLAKANSQYGDVANDGGDQGFKAKGAMPKAVDDAVFGAKPLAINTVSDPIVDTAQTTTGGVWLIEVTDSNPDKPIDGTNRDTLVSQATNTWAQGAWNDAQANIKDLITPAQKQYAITKAQGR